MNDNHQYRNTTTGLQRIRLTRISNRLLAGIILPVLLLFSGCYSFKDVSIPPEVKTFHIDLIGNKARYINPQLSPQITDKLRQKIVGQTRLSPVQDNAHYEISGTITDYSVTTSGISNQQASINRLNVGIELELRNTVNPTDPKTNFKAQVSRNFDFNANLSLTQAEPQLTPDIIKNMVDEMFNRLFSNW
ncbi:LPS assembly lipoprotein LptE [Paraflavitalea pollutisoli]|uniref:LPS assembly lipoprotein LptE n=1 Tax=Paraflavitalea pollutisoli TaxID=3034143 RepID=UPI0023EDE9DC|nr:LPS assembly lipoprotein LptE [Paraflavitalea sp. H1-2-19X]